MTTSKNKKKSKYDEMHSSIKTANSYTCEEIITLSNLNTYTSINCHNNNNDNNRTNIILDIKCYKAPLPASLHEQCMSLFQRNMNQLYQNSSWGLDLDAKHTELSNDHARFLIVTEKKEKEEDEECRDNANNKVDVDEDRENDMKVVAFTHFRFECSRDECNENNFVYSSSQIPTLQHDNEDEHESILYLYEIQIDSKIQRQSIGKRLMMLMQIIAMKMNMNKVMLTVFKSNCQAMNFYKNKLGYKVDGSSPDDDDEVDYEILSKVIQH